MSSNKQMLQGMLDFLAIFGLTWMLLAGIANQAHSAETANFVCDHEKIALRAEELRKERAIYWTGEELPGDWFHRCPIEYRPHSPAGGVTSFSYHQGEVNNIQMQVSGPLQDVLQDVLPHEVDHAVRHSLIRRPLSRFWDEGSASLAESTKARMQFHMQAQELAREPFPLSMLDALQYPADGREIFRVYTIGHSVCSFLEARSGAERLFWFQADPRQSAEKLQEFYRLTPGSLIEEWREWVAGTLPIERPVVMVETSDGCAPCLRLKADVDRGLFPGYRFEFVAPKGPTSVPRVSYKGQSITGYISPAPLKAWLASLDVVSIVPQPFVRNEQPSTPQAALGESSPPEELSSIQAAIEQLRQEKTAILESLAKIRQDVGEFQEAGVIGKVREILQIRSELKSLQSNSSGLREDLAILRESMRPASEGEEEHPWWYGLGAGIFGVLKRRYLNATKSIA